MTGSFWGGSILSQLFSRRSDCVGVFPALWRVEHLGRWKGETRGMGAAPARAVMGLMGDTVTQDMLLQSIFPRQQEGEQGRGLGAFL